MATTKARIEKNREVPNVHKGPSHEELLAEAKKLKIKANKVYRTLKKFPFSNEAIKQG